MTNLWWSYFVGISWLFHHKLNGLKYVWMLPFDLVKLQLAKVYALILVICEPREWLITRPRFAANRSFLANLFAVDRRFHNRLYRLCITQLSPLLAIGSKQLIYSFLVLSEIIFEIWQNIEWLIAIALLSKNFLLFYEFIAVLLNALESVLPFGK